MQELMDALRALGAKLGLAIEELVPHVVAYERAHAISCALLAVPFLLLGAFAAWRLPRLSASAKKTAKESGAISDSEVASILVVFSWVVPSFAVLIASLIVAAYLPTAIEPTGALIRKLVLTP